MTLFVEVKKLIFEPYHTIVVLVVPVGRLTFVSTINVNLVLLVKVGDAACKLYFISFSTEVGGARGHVVMFPALSMCLYSKAISIRHFTGTPTGPCVVTVVGLDLRWSCII